MMRFPILFALLFARILYRLDLLTIGNYYGKRYGKSIEVISARAWAVRVSAAWSMPGTRRSST